MFSTTQVCTLHNDHTPGLSCSYPITSTEIGGHSLNMPKVKVTKNKSNDGATPRAIVIIQEEQDKNPPYHHGQEVAATGSYPATTSELKEASFTHLPLLLKKLETASSPELSFATNAKRTDPSLSWRRTVECLNPIMFDIPGKDACLPHHHHELALLLSGLAGQQAMYDCHGSRPLSSWLSLLEQDPLQNDPPPLYTDDEMRRMHFLKEELRRLEMQRQVRWSLKFIEQYDLVQQAHHQVNLPQGKMALDEGVSNINHCYPSMPCQSDVAEMKLNNHSFMSAAASPTNVASLNQPLCTRLEPFPSCSSVAPSLRAEDEELSLDASHGATPQASITDGQGNSHQEEDDPPHEAQETATSIIPALIQQYSGRGVDMAPFPLKLHAVLANPRYHHVISWLPDGKSWRVIDAFLLERFVISRYFCHTKYSSFMRQVNGWGFARRSCRRGPDKGKSYHHVDFVRDDPERCLSMLRRRKARKKVTT